MAKRRSAAVSLRVGIFLFVILVIISGQALGADHVIKVGTIQPDSHPDCVLMREVFQEYVEKGSNGRIKVELYPNAQLGGDREMSEGVQLGILQMALPVTSITASFEGSFHVVEMPYLFTTREAAFEALDGQLGKELDRRLLSKGMMNLGYFENGFRHITNNRRPIQTIDDLKGLKIRTMETPIHVAFFKKVGANPTPMSFGELYTALQQGTVDGQENPIVLIYDSRFYEVQKYCSLTGHVFSVVHILANRSFIENLPDDLEKLVKEGARRFVTRHREIMPQEEKRLLAELEAKGMIVNDLKPENKQPLVEAARAVYDQFKGEIGSDIIELAERSAR